MKKKNQWEKYVCFCVYELVWIHNMNLIKTYIVWKSINKAHMHITYVHNINKDDWRETDVRKTEENWWSTKKKRGIKYEIVYHWYEFSKSIRWCVYDVYVYAFAKHILKLYVCVFVFGIIKHKINLLCFINLNLLRNLK